MVHPLPKIMLAVVGGLVLLAGFLTSLVVLPWSINAASPALYFVDKNSQPLTPTVRILCYATGSATSPLADLSLETNDAGQPLQSLPGGCNYIAALYLLHEQSSNKPNHNPAYQVYATSWEPGTRNVVQPSGAITITDDWPLVLFNVVASLEWEPATTSSFVNNLQTGLFGRMLFIGRLVNSGDDSAP